MLNENVRQFNLTVGKKIRSRRKELKKTQTWLAKKIGVTFQQIQKYEKGRNGLSVFRLLQLCNGLGVSFSYFVEGLDSELQNFVGSQDVQQDQVVTPVVKTSYNDM